MPLTPASAATLLLLVTIVLSSTASVAPAAILAAESDQRVVEARNVRAPHVQWERGHGRPRALNTDSGGGAIEPLLAAARIAERRLQVALCLSGRADAFSDAGVQVLWLDRPPPVL